MRGRKASSCSTRREARSWRSRHCKRVSAAGGVALVDHAAIDDVAAARAVGVGIIVALGLQQAEPLPILAARGENVGVDVAVAALRQLGAVAALRVVAPGFVGTDARFSP